MQADVSGSRCAPRSSSAAHRALAAEAFGQGDLLAWRAPCAHQRRALARYDHRAAAAHFCASCFKPLEAVPVVELFSMGLSLAALLTLSQLRRMAAAEGRA